jgi:hypothetical protein
MNARESLQRAFLWKQEHAARLDMDELTPYIRQAILYDLANLERGLLERAESVTGEATE